MTDYQADVVIVGAGVAGVLAAYKLRQAGADVLVLEAGPRVDRATALTTYHASPFDTPDAPYPSVPYAPHPSVLDPQGYFVQDGPDLFRSTYTRRVGGSTWHWLGTAMRHLPNDFRLRSLYGVADDWPISYQQLEPWYLAAEQELGVAGTNEFDLGSPRSGPYPMPGLAPTYFDELLAVATARLGIKVEQTPQARNSIVRDGRPACCGNATCVPICPIGAKYDATVHVRKFEQLGGRLLEEAIASFVEVDASGHIAGIRFLRPDRSEHRATGRIYVLAAHAIETPKLLLMSRTTALPHGVANRSDGVGRYLMDHPIQLSWALASEPVFPYRSPLENAGIEQFRDGEFRRERSAFRIAVGEDGWAFPGTPPLEVAATLVAEGLRGTALREAVGQHIARQFRFGALIEQIPDPESRVRPAFEHLDAIGIPRPRLSYRIDALTRKGLAAARAMHDRLFDAVGVTFRQHGDDYFGAGHVMGTYRMGNDAQTSVVNAEQRTHDHPNLYLLGSGVFPTVGTANPTLTIAALSLWAADTITRELSG